MKKIIAMAAIAMVAIGCNNEIEDMRPVVSNEIKVTASLPSTRATLTEFEVGDKMGLYAVEYNGDAVADVQTSGNYLNNERMSYDGAEWTSERTLYWSENACDFYGIYPYAEMGSMYDVVFEVATDQNSPETEDALGGYEASDLMWAKAEKVSKSDGEVALQFRHMMSRVVVNIVRGAKYEGELPEDIVVHLYNTATTALVDWRIGSLEKQLDSPKKTINMRQVDGDTFDAIVVPQFIERSTPLVEVTMEGIAYLLNYSMSFRPGYQHTITVTLNTSPDQEKIEIEIEGDVDDWQ